MYWCINSKDYWYCIVHIQYINKFYKILYLYDFILLEKANFLMINTNGLIKRDNIAHKINECMVLYNIKISKLCFNNLYIKKIIFR